MASRITMASSPAKHASRNPSSTGGNYGYDYNAAEQARLEAERQRRIKENKQYIADIKVTNDEVRELREKIAQAQTLLDDAVSGAKYKEYSKYLKGQEEWLIQIEDDLNTCGEKAADNIKKDGETYTFNRTNTEPNQKNNKNSNKTLSVNTDKLKELVTLLDGINKSASSIDSKVSGILVDSSKLGIPNFSNLKENSTNVTNSTKTLKDKLKQQIKDTEKIEKENSDIVKKVADWFSNAPKTLPEELEYAQSLNPINKLGNVMNSVESYVIENLSLPAFISKASGKDIEEIKEDVLKGIPSAAKEIASRKYGSFLTNYLVDNVQDVIVDAATSAIKLKSGLGKKQDSGSTNIKGSNANVTPTRTTTKTTPTTTTPIEPTKQKTPTRATTRATTTSQSKDTDTTTVNPKWNSDYLTAPKGYIKYEGGDGRLTKETWCDLDTTQLIINMHKRRI